MSDSIHSTPPKPPDIDNDDDVREDDDPGAFMVFTDCRETKPLEFLEREDTPGLDYASVAILGHELGLCLIFNPGRKYEENDIGYYMCQIPRQQLEQHWAALEHYKNTGEWISASDIPEPSKNLLADWTNPPGDLPKS